MLVLEINGKKKEIPCQWNEMTIDFYCGLYQIINKYKVTDEQIEDDKGKNLEKFYFTQETKMYKEIFSYMTKVPLNDVEKANMEDVMAVINSLDNIMTEYKPTGVDSFMFEGEKYYFPFEFLKTSTFGEYIEANQLELSTQYLKNGRFDILPEQMAILCKTMDEEVDLDNIDEKAKKFKNLTMDIVWEFSFFLNRRTVKSLGVIATFLEKVEQKVLQ